MGIENVRIKNFNPSLLHISFGLISCAYSGNFSSEVKLVYESNESQIHQPKFYVAEQNDMLFVVTRGSASSNDFKTDLDYQPITNSYGTFHNGFYTSAQFILNNTDIYVNKTNLPIYFVGHSLGGSVSQILTVLYREKYPNKSIGCLSFGPAPCMALKRNIHVKLKPYIVSIVLGNDIVPTLSIHNLYKVLQPFFDRNVITANNDDLIYQTAGSMLKTLKSTLHEDQMCFYDYLTEKVSNIISDVKSYHLRYNSGNKSDICFIYGNTFIIGNRQKPLGQCFVDQRRQLSFMHVTSSSISIHSYLKYREAVFRIRSF